MFRFNNNKTEVLLVHPGGPFWTKKDEGAWSIPKGVFEENESPIDAAKRETLYQPKIEELIFLQSIEGQAHNRAGSFNKRFYVNTTIDDIVRAVGKYP